MIALECLSGCVDFEKALDQVEWDKLFEKGIRNFQWLLEYFLLLDKIILLTAK